MNREQEDLYTVNGFIFGSAQDTELAKQELNSARYIEKKIENKSPTTVLAIYKAAIEKKMFRTPVGYAYLHDIQKRLMASGVSQESMGAIPLYQIYSNLHEEKAPRVVKVKKKADPLKRRNTMLVIVNMILIVMIIVMFAISVSGDSPTVLNYRRTIENEYSAWKQQLDERENAIREKERELEMSYGYE